LRKSKTLMKIDDGQKAKEASEFMTRAGTFEGEERKSEGLLYGMQAVRREAIVGRIPSVNLTQTSRINGGAGAKKTRPQSFAPLRVGRD